MLPEILRTSAPSGPPSHHNGYADADEDRDDDESRKIGGGIALCFAARRLVDEIQFQSNVLTGSQRRSGASGNEDASVHVPRDEAGSAGGVGSLFQGWIGKQ